MSRALLPGLENHKLPTVAEHLGVPLMNHHDALEDAAMCGLVAARLLRRCPAGTTLTQLAVASGQRFDQPMLIR